MPGQAEDIKSVKCASCGSDLGRSTRIEGSGEDAEEVPIAKCLSCGREYDQKTEEYYHVFAEKFRVGLDRTALKLGAKGDIDGIEYEIIGRIRYQDEEEWELDIWDEWLAVDADGSYHWFVEEEGNIHSYQEYVPESMDLEISPSTFEFEGRRFSKDDTGFVARIVYAEGELTWKPGIGEPARCYDFRKDGYNYTIEQSEDEVSVTRGKRVPYRKVIMAFRKSDYLGLYDNTMMTRQKYRRKAFVYLAMCAVSFAAAVWGCFSGSVVPGAVDRSARMVLAANQPKTEEGGSLYFSQVLFTRPVELKRTDTLYQVRVEVDSGLQGLSREWASYRLMLIKEDRYRELTQKVPVEARRDARPPAEAGGSGNPADAQAAGLGDLLDEVDAFAEPLESLVVTGDFWDEDGYDDEGYWHESETAISRDFLLDEPGRYYVYLELYSQNPRNPDALKITVVEGVRSYRYYVIALLVFIILWGVNQVKSRSYNELPFDVAVD
jgi:hypothetical protein